MTRTFNPSANSFIYKINFSENQPPVIIADNQISSVSEWVRYLDIENFIAEITAWLDENKDNDNTLLIEHELELFPVVITRLKVNLNEKKPRSVQKGDSLDDKCVKLIIGFVPLEGLLIMKSVDFDLALNYKMSDWAVQSDSTSGCELASHVSSVDEELSLGELVAIVCSDNRGKSISVSKIAHIRSLRQTEQGALLVELEYLSESAYPLTYIVISEEGAAINATRSNGIYLLDNLHNNEGPLMIVNRKHYTESQQYLVKTREKVCTVEATKLIRQTLRYCFFQYKILQEERKDSSGAINIINLAV